MKDLKIESSTKMIQFSQNDIAYVRDDEELAQSVWVLLNTNLSNIMADNENIMLGQHFNDEYIANVINRVLVDFDKRIATTKINDISFSDVDRTLTIDLKIITKEGSSLNVGGDLNVG